MVTNLSVFVDANVLLHFKQLADIDWPGICDVQEVEIVVCLPVIREVDRLKSDPLLGPRAKTVIRGILKHRKQGGMVRTSTTMMILNREIRFERFPTEMSPDSADDRILFLAKEYAAGTGHAVAVCTDDAGMMLRCDAHGVPVVTLSDDLRHENPTSQQQRRIRALELELAEAKQRIPQIAVMLTRPREDPAQELTFELIRCQMERTPQDELARERLNYKPIAAELHDLMGMRNPLAIGLVPPTQQELAAYQSALERYFSEYEMWINLRNEVADFGQRMIKLDACIENSGSCPAEDLEITVYLPPGLAAVCYENKEDEREDVRGTLPSPPVKPTPPDPPKSRTAFESLIGGISPVIYGKSWEPLIRPLPELNYSPLNVWERAELDGDEKKGFIVRLWQKRMMHKSRKRFGVFTLAYCSWEAVNTSQLKVTISAANIPTLVESDVLLKLKVTSGTC